MQIRSRRRYEVADIVAALDDRNVPDGVSQSRAREILKRARPDRIRVRNEVLVAALRARKARIREGTD